MSIQCVRACLAALASTAALASAGAASAQSSDVDVAFNIGVVSDYVFRGVSQTEEDAAMTSRSEPARRGAGAADQPPSGAGG